MKTMIERIAQGFVISLTGIVIGSFAAADVNSDTPRDVSTRMVYQHVSVENGNIVRLAALSGKTSPKKYFWEF